MKLALLSDLHGHLPAIEPCDLVVIAGDIVPAWAWQTNVARQLKWLEESFNPWVEALPAPRVVMTFGNHDWFGPTGLWKPPTKVTLLLDQAAEIDGIRIYGTPWSPEFRTWAYMDSEEGLAGRYAAIPADTELLISHAPPRGVVDRTATGEEVGSMVLRQRLAELHSLRLVVCGHIHECGGEVEPCGSVCVYNAAIVNLAYQPVWPIEYIDWDDF